METIQITIPKPCHEDWDKMSPEDKGRFCNKCCKTVTDFSSKTTLEIQQFIIDHKEEKICGRFNNNQLKKPIRIEIPFNTFVHRISSTQSLVLSLLIAFGTTLFSCTTHNDQIVGEIGLVETIPQKIVDTDSVVAFITGEISAPIDVEIVKGIDLGNSKLDSELPDTTIELTAVNINAELIPLTDYHIMGAIAMSSVGHIENDSSETDSVVSKFGNEIIDQPVESNVIFPNPTHDLINLRLNLPDALPVQADLYDMSGKLIRSLIPAQLMETGERDFQFNISDLKPATYFIRIIKGELVDTKRVVLM